MAAFYTGIFGDNRNTSTTTLDVFCPTGNCTWEPFQTLAVCSECANITNQIQTLSTSYPTVYHVPGGPYLTGDNIVLNITNVYSSDPVDSTLLTNLLMMGTSLEQWDVEAGPWALNCSLRYCVQTISTRSVNGVFEEHVTSTFYNRSLSPFDSTDLNAQAVLSPPGSNDIFSVVAVAARAISFWLPSLTGSVTADIGEFGYSSDYMQALYSAVGGQPWTGYNQTGLDSQTEGIPALLSRLAKSMTNNFRTETGSGIVTQHGQAQSTKVFVHVRWGWITLPAVVVLLSGAFLIAVIVKNRSYNTILWKSSALAMLYNDLDDDTRRAMEACSSPDDLTKQARRVLVRLGSRSEDGGLRAV